MTDSVPVSDKVLSAHKFSLIKERANEIAKEGLEEDEVLAVGIAAPNLPIAVVQFRNQIKSADVNNHTFLNTYWRELGVAWNQTDGDSRWGVPFRDCGPLLYGRWLWPFSVTLQINAYK